MTQAAFFFIYRFMANHTAENPEGILDQDVLKSFFAISGSGDNLTWTPGYERIPENWYRRSLTDPYGINGLDDDAATLQDKAPYTAQSGCNMGQVNTYTPFNNSDTNTSDYNFSDPGDDLCYGISLAISAAGLDGQVGLAQYVADEILTPIQDALNCDVVTATNQTIGQACPGYSSYGGPTGPVAPGAVQD